MSLATGMQAAKARRRPAILRLAPVPAFEIAGALLALAVAWVWPLRILARDLFAAHMLQHLLVMNVAALLFALAWRSTGGNGGGGGELARSRGPTALAIVTSAQLLALWVWHAPGILAAAHHSLLLHGLMQVSLFGFALLFWSFVLGQRGRPVWPSVFALLMTAKIFCLLGAVFIFARRPLYSIHGTPEAWGLSALDDQQLAGLLMISSCTMTYVAAAITLFARWLAALEAPRRAPTDRQPMVTRILRPVTGEHRVCRGSRAVARSTRCCGSARR